MVTRGSFLLGSVSPHLISQARTAYMKDASNSSNKGTTRGISLPLYSSFNQHRKRLRNIHSTCCHLFIACLIGLPHMLSSEVTPG